MPVSNINGLAAGFVSRLIGIEQERLDNAEMRKDLFAEMRAAKLLKHEVDGIKRAVKLHFESQEKREHRERVEDFAESLGELRDLPLGVAAMARHSA